MAFFIPVLLFIAPIVADLVVEHYTGKDILYHVTGYDVWGAVDEKVINPFIDYILPEGGTSSPDAGYDWSEWFQGIQDNMDAWGFALMDNMDAWGTAMSEVLFFIVACLFLIIFLLIVRGSR